MTEVLEPGHRSSLPHAEATEEECVYVLEGNPSAWIDGELHPLEPDVAEPAITIVDDYQQKGLGRVLLERLVGAAPQFLLIGETAVRDSACESLARAWAETEAEDAGHFALATESGVVREIWTTSTQVKGRKLVYRFELENGEVLEVKGNEEIEYDGEMHTAANLFDALKEGYYGKF